MHSERSLYVFLSASLLSLSISSQSSAQAAPGPETSVDPGAAQAAPSTAYDPNTLPAQPLPGPADAQSAQWTSGDRPLVATLPPAAPPGQTEAKPENGSWSFSGGPGKGATLTAPDELFSLNVRARLQFRATLTETRSDWTELVGVKTARLYFQGHVLTKDLKYVLQLALGSGDFEEGSSSPIFDAYLDYTKLRDLNIRVGQYFVPFDRARTVREYALQLVDRPVLIPELTLDRDAGITLSSSDLGGTGGIFGYALGVFGGDGRNRVATSRPGLLYVVRLQLNPFGSFDDNVEGDIQRLPKPRLAIGVAGAYNQHTDRPRSTTGTRYVLDGFNYLHGAADLVFKYHGFSLLSEIVVRKAHRDNRAGKDAATMKDVTEWSREGWGWLVQAGLMLTNHLEVAGRWGQFKTLGKTDPKLQQLVDQSGHEATAGLNWYVNEHFFKFQADFGIRYGEWSKPRDHVARLQVDAMF